FAYRSLTRYDRIWPCAHAGRCVSAGRFVGAPEQRMGGHHPATPADRAAVVADVGRSAVESGRTRPRHHDRIVWSPPEIIRVERSKPSIVCPVSPRRPPPRAHDETTDP